MLLQLTYRGSEEESQDLLAYYSEASGDMHVVFTNIMCSEPDIDSHRFMDVILEAQAQGGCGGLGTQEME